MTRQQRYYLKNSEKLKKYSRQYRRDNLEKCKAREITRGLEWRAWLDKLKSMPCTDCGREFPPCAMDFDHVTGKKSLNIGQAFKCSKEKVIAEIAKCELVCANCHRVRTWVRQRSLRSSEIKVE